MDFIQRKLKPRPYAASSTGRSRGSLNLGTAFGRVQVFEAIGPARAIFRDQLGPAIVAYLNDNNDQLRDSACFVDLSLFMMGKSPERTKPMVMFVSDDKQARKGAFRMIKNSCIMEQYADFGLGEMELKAEFENLLPLGSRPGAIETSDTESACFIEPEDSVELLAAETDALGTTRLMVYTLDGWISSAFAGGSISYNGSYFCHGADHSMRPQKTAKEVANHNQQAPAAGQGEDECEVVGWSDDEEDDEEFVDIMSRGSATPIAGDSRSASQSPPDSEAQDCSEFSYGSFKEQDAHVSALQSRLEVLMASVEPALQSPGRAVPTRPGRIVLRSALLDSAFVQIQPEEDEHGPISELRGTAIPLESYEEHIESTPSDAAIKMATPHGTIGGALSETPSFVRLPGSRVFQEVYVGKTNQPLVPGDCGSWAKNAITGKLFGHVIAGSPTTGLILLMPAARVFAEALAAFSAQEARPQKWTSTTIAEQKPFLLRLPNRGYATDATDSGSPDQSCDDNVGPHERPQEMRISMSNRRTSLREPAYARLDHFHDHIQDSRHPYPPGKPVEMIEEEGDGAVRIKRSASQELEDEEEIMHSMARRKNNASPEELAPKKCHDPGCNKEFKRPCDLAKHEKTHSRPWKCPVPTCKYYDYGWPTKKEMDRHHNDKHSAAPPMYECQYKPCSYKSKRESNCKQHMEKAHGWTYVRTKTNGRKSGFLPSMTNNSAQPTPQLQNLPGPDIKVSLRANDEEKRPKRDNGFGEERAEGLRGRFERLLRTRRMTEMRTARELTEDRAMTKPHHRLMHSPSYSSIRHLPTIPTPPSPRTLPRISKPVELLRDSYDAIVIDSGYGGGVAAPRIAQTKDALDHGRQQWPGEYPHNPGDAVPVSSAPQWKSVVDSANSPPRRTSWLQWRGGDSGAVATGQVFGTTLAKSIREIQFGIFSQEEIKAMSVAHIVYPDMSEEPPTTPEPWPGLARKRQLHEESQQTPDEGPSKSQSLNHCNCISGHSRCSVVFKSKNEWKRHVTSQHLRRHIEQLSRIFVPRDFLWRHLLPELVEQEDILRRKLLQQTMPSWVPAWQDPFKERTTRMLTDTFHQQLRRFHSPDPFRERLWDDVFEVFRMLQFFADGIAEPPAPVILDAGDSSRRRNLLDTSALLPFWTWAPHGIRPENFMIAAFGKQREVDLGVWDVMQSRSPDYPIHNLHLALLDHRIGEETQMSEDEIRLLQTNWCEFLMHSLGNRRLAAAWMERQRGQDRIRGMSGGQQRRYRTGCRPNDKEGKESVEEAVEGSGAIDTCSVSQDPHNA